MFPIGDDIPTSSRAYVTVGLIVLNCLIFLFEVSRPGDGMQEVTWKYGYVPAELVQESQEFEQTLLRHPPMRPVRDRFGRPLAVFFGRPLAEPDTVAIKAVTAVPASINIFTCMFLHGGWMHLLGNMLFLWIFGNNVEDRLGSCLFLVFYLGTGVCGNLAHTFVDSSSSPLVGASGAISGVMGAYILLYPRARILAIVPIGWYPMTFSLPAWVYLIFYIALQNIWPALFAGGQDNVARWAHIGGFFAGMAMIHVFPHVKRTPRAVPVYNRDEDDADFVL
jgi:membrane associated rhomboid family serine protease